MCSEYTGRGFNPSTIASTVTVDCWTTESPDVELLVVLEVGFNADHGWCVAVCFSERPGAEN